MLAWKSAPLGDLVEIQSGLWTGKKGPMRPVLVLRNTNFTKSGALDLADVAEIEVEEGQLSKRLLARGDIILEKSGGGPKQPVGRVVLFQHDGEFSFSNFTSRLRIRDKSGLLPAFLHLYLHHLYQSGVTAGIQSHSTGIRNLDLTAYKALEVPLPPLPEQKRIVAILDEAFEGIRIATANAEKNLANADELFDARLHELISAIVTDRVLPFEECIEKVRYTTKVKRSDFLEAGAFPIVSQEAEFINGHWDEEGDVFRVTSPLVVFGDHTQALKYIDFDFVLGADGVKILKPKSILRPRYFYYVLMSMRLKRLGYARHYRLLAEKTVSVPDVAIQDQIIQQLDLLSEETATLAANYAEHLSRLVEIKQSILSRAFSGQLTATKGLAA